MLIKQPKKVVAYIICPPGDRSGVQIITLYMDSSEEIRPVDVHII